MFVFGGWFESSSSSRMIFLQDFYFLEPSSVIWSVPRVRPAWHHTSPLARLSRVKQATGCPPSARAYAAAVGMKDSFIVVGGTEGHLPWQVDRLFAQPNTQCALTHLRAVQKRRACFFPQV